MSELIIQSVSKMRKTTKARRKIVIGGKEGEMIVGVVVEMEI